MQSLSGAITIMMGGPIDWSTERERTRLAAASVNRQSRVWTSSPARRFGFHHRQHTHSSPVQQQSRGLGLVKSEAITEWLKHMNTHKAGIRQDIKAGRIDATHVPGKTNLNDVFAKEMCDAQRCLALRAAPTSPKALQHHCTTSINSRCLLMFRLLLLLQLQPCRQWTHRWGLTMGTSKPAQRPRALNGSFHPTTPVQFSFPPWCLPHAAACCVSARCSAQNSKRPFSTISRAPQISCGCSQSALPCLTLHCICTHFVICNIN